MRGIFRQRIAGTVFALSAVFLAFTGCQTSTRSGLPEHIRTVEVQIFQNKTMYKSIEGVITRSIIDRINADPNIRVSSWNGDAVITGEITDVKRETLRETTTNEPGTVRITLYATYSFYDNVNGRYIIEDAAIDSRATGQFAGIYEASHGGDSSEGERRAAQAMAAEIVRRTIGMW